MNNTQLDNVLKSARIPEPPAEFWQAFPGRVIAELDRRRSAGPCPATTPPSPALSLSRLWRGSLFWRTAFGTAFAVVCLAVAFALSLRPGRSPSADAAQLAAAQKYFHEIQSLFPNQVEAIEFDAHGARLALADHADVPASPPVYVALCSPQGCRRFVTFSGQQIHINGDVFDVLLNRQGEVLVVGKQWVWPDPTRTHPAPYRVQARPLPITS